MSETIQIFGLLAALALIKASQKNYSQTDKGVRDLLNEPMKYTNHGQWHKDNDPDNVDQFPQNLGTHKHWSQIVYETATWYASDKITDPIAFSPGDDNFIMVTRRGDGANFDNYFLRDL